MCARRTDCRRCGRHGGEHSQCSNRGAHLSNSGPARRRRMELRLVANGAHGAHGLDGRGGVSGCFPGDHGSPGHDATPSSAGAFVAQNCAAVPYLPCPHPSPPPPPAPARPRPALLVRPCPALRACPFAHPVPCSSGLPAGSSILHLESEAGTPDALAATGVRLPPATVRVHGDTAGVCAGVCVPACPRARVPAHVRTVYPLARMHASARQRVRLRVLLHASARVHGRHGCGWRVGGLCLSARAPLAGGAASPVEVDRLLTAGEVGQIAMSAVGGTGGDGACGGRGGDGAKVRPRRALSLPVVPHAKEKVRETV
jgi:hypothetical protein